MLIGARSLTDPVSQAVKTTGEAVIRIESTIVKDKDNKILDWLTPISYGSQYSDLLKVRRRGTGQWFLDSAQYQTWLGTQKQTLFCPGIPGAGKTILASIVVEDLFSRFENDQEVGIAYLYCNFQRQDKQNFDDLLASLLRQLAQRRPSLPDELTTLHDKHKDKQTRPSVDEIVAGLQSVARIYSRIFIVVDALDECEKECMSKLLSQLFGLQASTTANVLATSRPIELIRKKFEGRSEIANISARDEDVEKCLDIDMKTLPLLDEENEGLTEKRKDDLKKEIKTTLIKCVDGMFLLARLHLASLSDKTTESELCTALKSLPRGQNALAQAYGLNMERIRSQQPGFRFLAEMVLILLTCAKRQLTTLELQEALAVAEGDLTLDKTKREHTSIIVSVCAGLVTVDADSGIIRLVHETTREYLASHMHCIRPQKALTIVEDPMKVDDEKNASAMAAAHKIFAIICVTYLSFSDFESGFCQTDAAFEERLQSNQLYKYAAHNWGHHTREASTGCPSVIQFLNDAPKVEASSQALMAVKSSWGSNWSQIVPRRVTGLHLASYFGVQQAVSKLLQDWQNIDQEDDVRRTPLSYAAENGYEAIIKLLLAIDKVDIDAKDSWDRTPLSYAAENGHEAVVKLLLAMDKVDVDAKDNWDRTLLSYAAENGHEAVVKLLLATDKVDVDAEDNWDRTPLSYAAENGHEAIIKLLLATDKVDVYAKDDKSRTSLLYATKNGHEAVVKLLLATDKVNVNTRGNWDRTPLSYAAGNGHETIVKLLLAIDKVDVDGRANWDRTPLSYAAGNGREAVVKLLLAMDKVDVDVKDNQGRTSLSYAAENGHEAVFKLLLATDKVDVDTKDDGNRTPLSYAAENGWEAIVKLLLAMDKVDVDAKDRQGRTPLSHAAENGHEAAVKLLLAMDKVDVDAEDNWDRTPLSYAAENGHEAIIKLLLATDKVDVDAKDDKSRTSLLYATKNGHEAVVKLLLATDKVDVDAEDNWDRTPLSYAAENGHEAVVKLLLATDKVDVDTKDDENRTPLSHAAENDHEAVVKLLLAMDKVDVDAKDT
ncbi:hypothetical protein LMH87_001375 [Akanthomyces muscarius]|uniref:NACHT domain-containing protein n=1 Tax=Akanthomyces muscarius TaxID=2231603 RepID=A0A9W8Q6L6_AKAMU|nr:hypothetical protein LMH87_001375 [Akanthomyces muscarius]KAJ4146816.1 hypothetical protein LMH87_001375 [Akanthomyces muscarius]